MQFAVDWTCRLHISHSVCDSDRTGRPNSTPYLELKFEIYKIHKQKKAKKQLGDGLV
jgi:hypothetical protein